MLHLTFIRRQLTTSRHQSAILIICVALSMVTLVALRGFGDSVDRAFNRDARALIASDVRADSNYPFDQALDTAVRQEVEAGRAEAARTYEFYSVVRRQAEDASLLANLKVVEPGYPFYGAVTLASGRTLQEALMPGNVLVEPALLERLHVAVGDTLRVGETALTIGDTVLSEPDRPVNFFALGPRMLISSADLKALRLVQPGSRVSYRWLLKAAGDGDVERIAAALRAAADMELIDIDTYRTAETGVERFFRNFLFFLSLVGIFTLLLAGIGIQSSLTAFLRERYTTIAIVKTLGAQGRFVTFNFYMVVLLLGAVGAGMGMVLGFVLQWILPTLLSGFLPPDLELIISSRAIVESMALGLVVVLVFTFLPLYRLEELRPNFIFRKEESPATRRLPYLATVIVILALFAALVVWQLGDLQIGLYFAGGAVALLLIAAALTEGTLHLLRRQDVRALVPRQALRGLFRPRSATRAIVVTLSAALGVLFCIFLIEQNLRASFVDAYPVDAPNVFFLDIQPDQKEAFAATLGMQAEFVPTLRASLSAVNGQAPARDPEEEEAGESRTPQYTLTYRARLQENETLLEGDVLFAPIAAGPQVSVLHETMQARGLKLGDKLTFRIQGVLLVATISSVRTREGESVQPFFSFVFPPEVLASTPHTLFTGIRMPPADIPALQNRMVARFSNVSVIDATATIATFAGVVQRITQVVRFFALFSILAGLLIVFSSVYATRLARIQEAAYYKVLGATRSFVASVFALESVFLGLLSGTLALAIAHTSGWLIMRYLFELPYQANVGASVLLVLLTVTAVTLVGLGASVDILRSRPITYLRQNSDEE